MSSPNGSENVSLLQKGSVQMTAIHAPASAAAHGHNVPNEQHVLHSKDAPLTLHGEIFHVFISYRVKTESDLVGALYHQLISTASTAKIPGNCKWPSGFKKPDVPSSRIHVFWDANTLAPGLTWKDKGFARAISKSLVFSPMLSDGVVESWYTPVVDYVDNVLLELILALEFNRHHASGEEPSSVYPCKYIVPVFINELFSKKSNLNNEIARATMTEAARLLDEHGLHPSCSYSPASVFTALSEFQGVQMYLYDKQLKQQAIGAVTKEIATAVTMCIQQSSVFMDDFKAHHPRALELCGWLQTHNFSKYAGIIARHGITSVDALSKLDIGSAVPILAEDCALSCGESRMQAIVSLGRAVAMAKASELSLPLSARFKRFVDTDASILSAIYSSCGVDTIFTKHQILSFSLVASFGCACLGTFLLDSVDYPFLSVSIVANPLFFFFLSAVLLCLSTWPIFFGGSIFRVPPTQFKPRMIAVVALLFVPCMSSIILVYIKAVHFGSMAFNHSILCQVALERGELTVSFDTCYLYEVFVIFPIQFIAFCTMSAFAFGRQELAFRSFIFGLIAALSAFFGFAEMFRFQNFIFALRHFSGGLIGVVFLILITFETFNVFSRKKARAHLKKDEENYNEIWNGFRNDNGDNQSKHPAQALSDEISKSESFKKVLEDPNTASRCDNQSKHPAQALSDEISKSKSFKKVLEDPNTASRWFRRAPRVLQEHSSVDDLFDDVELVDVAFQQLVRCWVEGCNDKELGRFVQQKDLEAFKIGMKGVSATVCPGPVKQVTRSISKTVRSYRGNFRRLTDLVRTTVVCDSFEGIRSFLLALDKKSICSIQDFNSFWPPDDHDKNSPREWFQTCSWLHSFFPETPAAIYNFEELSSSIVMQILRIRNRFDPSPEYKKHLFGGYRDISLKVKMAFVCLPSGSNADCVKFVPMSRWREPGTKRLVFEIQLHHKRMKLGSNEAEEKKHHRRYVTSRDMMNA